jgi:hypothetical protein
MKKSVIATTFVGVGTGQSNASGYTFTDLGTLGGGGARQWLPHLRGRQRTHRSNLFESFLRIYLNIYCHKVRELILKNSSSSIISNDNLCTLNAGAF